MARPSDADVAILNEYFDAFNRKDVDRWVELFPRDVTFVPTALWSPPGTTYHGHAGVRSYAHEAFARFPDLHAEPPELRDLGDRILGCGTVVSGSDVDTAGSRRIACLFTLRSGQIHRIDAFMSESEALAAARRTSSDQFRFLFESAPDAVFLADDQGTLIDGNAAACLLCATSVDALRGRTLFDLVARGSVPRLNELWSRLRTRGQAVGEVEVLSPSGERHRLAFRATADFVPGRHVIVLSAGSSVSASEERHESSSRLTPREQEVLRLLALGLTGSEIAEQLVLSPHTVRRHVEKSIARLEAKNRVHAVSIALRRGEIEL